MGELIVSRYIAESIITDAEHFGHVAFVNCVQVDINNVAMSLYDIRKCGSLGAHLWRMSMLVGVEV